MQLLFSYRQANQEQLNDHISKLSREAIHSALVRYKEAGDSEMVRKIKLAITMAKLRGLEAEAAALGNSPAPVAG